MRKHKVASATISWPTTKGDSYRIFWGTSPSNLNNNIDVGPAGSHVIDGLSIGTTYYFSVKARNAAGVSPPSKPVAYTPMRSRGKIAL